ncbi:oxygen-binding di-iron domain-containing protein [Acidithiobacillus caldus]|uniref:MBL fold metallo-hydrolase n=1 Tax=Acidithiobacillus caldus TaxID=33059 RepID=UPI00056E8229|nr:MBL fold metallo-hydrolase [Acidithiobacillus caldus]MBU2729623.1 MBL fold metallo-hydrolase [Acidithiobacillus caldus]MBU2734236.1 MBL fold metallo-hydrolase [Acidithiobacillus caldus ATCC 51756]MBU2746082.1 MBL fold metallo-hydrolase [Acidithiobacillus caldus]MBU2779663.1 MBL fold metallo-hydrolase [Acidithiobacillus caldus]
MKSAPVVQLGKHRWWIVYDQDEERVIDSNIYVMESDGEALILDPGGFEIFPQVFAAVVEAIPPDAIRTAFVSHQDPDIASSLPLWNACNPKIQWYIPKLWDGFIRHYGALDATFVDIPDEGMEIRIGGQTLQILPAHYLHSSANFHVYDPVAKVLFSGDVGAALLPKGHSAFLDRRRPEAFGEHIAHAKYFHERWMPSNEAKRDWCDRVRQLDVQYLCPQHGAIYQGEHVQRFLDWFEALPVGRVDGK